MAWWIWTIMGLAMFLIELLIPSEFVITFFGISGLAIGFLAYFKILTELWLQGVVFGAIVVVSTLLFRKPLLAKLIPKTAKYSLKESGIGIVLQEIAPHQVGKVEYRGTPWNARNIGQTKLAPGQRCAVCDVSDLTLSVREESN